MGKKIIILMIVYCILLSGCTLKSYAPQITQSLEDVVQIELLDTHDNDEMILYTLEDSEIPEFWDKFMGITFHRSLNDPSTDFGPLAVKIYYTDGGIDLIGTEINTSYDASGVDISSGWYYIANRTDFEKLFSQYVDESLLPEVESWGIYYD